MIQHLEIQQVTHRRLDLLDARITKFNYLATIHADKMIMLLKAVGLFILREVLAKLVLGNEVTTNQEFERIVYSGAANPVIGIFHVDIQRLCIKMIRAAVDFFQDSVAFRCATQMMCFQVRREDFFHFFK